ncbi:MULTISPECIES: TetR/AcrR family transcriptional regulator [Streptomyces]|uniref:TetR family transcriptional regulator n=2 Tax=Streptomyces rimosus subsp. rimosus TaxID=132474 RepID=A0A8A1UVA2_STRR1|nr:MULTISPECIES: TetR/AcrR family transcriptional regulator [Streptomyces]KOG73426.1 TetR family transcriptional regulator [Kitasatospora aureofaciens]MYT45661.1 TetR family transcriptional regulator [Streptomyces sp. SID5471]KOT39656.1 TetR family transcriptional regulator [Streptomyces rimosus subsp. rimosus]KOT39912.1 TetR family transcriptional regulator [Streptomyces sp. NRRL WC-3701]KOT56627.1 TetR family transcriptional regulator [Streptomyces rimosus subsp. rimosus]
MSPRSPSVNEELRRRSRERLLQATVELVDERGYEATTLGDIACRAGSARGLISYYFPGKRQLLQSAVHRLMHHSLQAALEREPVPTGEDAGRERLARAIDAILGLAQERPLLMRTHMAGILTAEGFIQCPEQQRLAFLLRDTVERYGSKDADTDYRLLRALLMGSVVAVLLPGAPMPAARLRAELFQRYGLDWELGVPPSEGPEPPLEGPPPLLNTSPAGPTPLPGPASAGPSTQPGPSPADSPAVAEG